ncbi:hypothetical protein [Bradyrhizobium sp. ISRA463]|uniref:hypothetical protein n=1 Tax=Bradyrhizobium sp. ISRA463 TaxID=2866199 RepID=UPI00247AEE6C|nr:hypothetical protein [Bradyrhizobium sp. ISRA463]WGS19995.1 hypothetical protein MTX22_37795 [Bradyrhizobium sp. ISRA463]
MAPEAALNEPLVRRVLTRVLDRLDAQPQAERTHSIRINLDAGTAPEIHAADSLSARAVAWASIDGAVAAGWTTIGYRKHRRHGAREEREPYLDFDWPDAVEELMREKLSRPRKATSYASQWRIRLTQQNLPISATSLAKLLAAPIEISTRSIDEVLSRFLSIRELAREPLLLREVSSRVFGGFQRSSTVVPMLWQPSSIMMSAPLPSSRSFSTFMCPPGRTPFCSSRTLSLLNG